MTDCRKPPKTKKPKPKKECKPPTFSRPTTELDELWPKIEFPHSLRIIGPKHFEAARNFIPSLVFFGIAATLGAIYFTEFRTVLQYVPYYGGKYATHNKNDD